MTHFTISNTISGAHLGIYQGDTKAQALDALANDAGYEDHAAACRAAPVGDGELKVEPAWTVWLGARASIWSHRGYTVSGERVICEDKADAATVLQGSFADADALVEVECDAGAYYYDTQEAADRDQDGSRAIAVVAQDEVAS